MLPGDVAETLSFGSISVGGGASGCGWELAIIECVLTRCEVAPGLRLRRGSLRCSPSRLDLAH